MEAGLHHRHLKLNLGLGGGRGQRKEKGAGAARSKGVRLFLGEAWKGLPGSSHALTTPPQGNPLPKPSPLFHPDADSEAILRLSEEQTTSLLSDQKPSKNSIKRGALFFV